MRLLKSAVSCALKGALYLGYVFGLVFLVVAIAESGIMVHADALRAHPEYLAYLLTAILAAALTAPVRKLASWLHHHHFQPPWRHA